MICKFNENLKTDNIKLNRVISEYKGKKFYIYSEDNLSIEQLNSNIAFLYSDKQEINIKDNKDSYEIIFKKDSYYNEPLILYKNKMKMINLECKEQEKQIICNIKKTKLLEILAFKGEKYYLSQLTNSEGLYIFDSVLNITINYNNIKKKDIYINIKKLMTQFKEKNNFLAYETNTTDINKVSTDFFILARERKDDLECVLKKNDEKLLLLCKALIPGKSFLGEIKKTNLAHLNILYNFIIIDGKNEEEYTIYDKEGSIISLVFPEELDFNSTDSYIIRYITDYPERLKGIKLNSKSSDSLICKDKKDFKECIVPEKHFNEEGYYYTYYTNSLSKESIAYEASIIKIILKPKKPDESDKTDKPGESDDSNKKTAIIIIVGSVVGGLVIIGIILFFVIRRCKGKKKNIDVVPRSEEDILTIN